MKMNKPITIDPEITLKRLEIDDAQELFDLTEENQTYLRRWVAWIDSTNTVDNRREFIQGTIDQFEKGLGPTYAIIVNNSIAGVIGFHPIDQSNHVGEIGYWLSEEHQGKGIMTNCCKALIKQAFESLNINRLQIPAAEDNIKSRSIPERLGFTFEGILRECENLYGNFVNQAMYSMLKSEYEKRFSSQL